MNRIFSQLLVLADFTVQELVDRTGTKANTVRTVLRRLPADFLVEADRGAVAHSRPRGGQPKRWRLTDEGRDSLARRLQTVLADVSASSQLSDPAQLFRSVDTTLQVAENALTAQDLAGSPSEEWPREIARLVDESVSAADFELNSLVLEKGAAGAMERLKENELRSRLDRLRGFVKATESLLTKPPRGKGVGARRHVERILHGQSGDSQAGAPNTEEYATMGLANVTVADLVKLPGGPSALVCVSSQTAVGAALRLMRRHGLDVLPVIDGKKQVGVIDIQVLVRSVAKSRSVSRVPVRLYMRRDRWPVVRSTAPAEEVSRKLVAMNVSHALVAARSGLTGVVTKGDVYRAAVPDLVK